MSSFLPYGTQWIEDDDVQAVADALRSGNLTQGPRVKAFEEALAEYVGTKHCVAFCNATAALHVAVAALDVGEGAELQALGVGSQVLCTSVYWQPWYRETYRYAPGFCPCAEAYYERALSLPLYPKMTDADVRAVVDAVRKVCA